MILVGLSKVDESMAIFQNSFFFLPPCCKSPVHASNQPLNIVIKKNQVDIPFVYVKGHFCADISHGVFQSRF